MRKYFLTLVVFAFLCNVKGQISVFPYNQDFESFTTCSNTCGDPCALSAGWSNPTNDDIDWVTNTGGTTSGATGPAADHTLGTSSGHYLYTETSGSCNNSEAFLVSPYFDFTSGVFEVSFWYHMFGGTMGTMHIDMDTTQGSGAWVQDVVAPWTDNQDVWQQRIVQLCDFGGLDSIRFRIRANTGTSFQSDMAVDDVQVRKLPAIDLAAVRIDSLPFGCGLGTEDIRFCFRNSGETTLSLGTQIPLSYRLNNGTIVSETLAISSPLAPCDTFCFLFSTPGNFSTAGNYVVEAWTSFPSDTLGANDTILENTVSIPVISSLTYTQDFESGQGGWTSSGSNNSWQFGTPAAIYINGPGSGVNAWATNLTGDHSNNEISYLESPCFDFGAVATDPTIRFGHIYEIESGFDQSWVETSTNGGVTWNKVGTAGSGTNWYNNTSTVVWDGNSAAGPGNWQTAENVLSGTSGSNDVRIRYAFTSDGSVVNEGVGVDDILIFTTLTDGQIVSVDSPVTRCGLTASENIVATFLNSGTTVIDTATFCYSVNGGTAVCETVTGLTVAAGGTFSHTFSTAANFSTPGNYTVMVWLTAPGEEYPANDTLTTIIQHVPTISTFPYLEDFEAGNGFWSDGGTASSWQWGQPSGLAISGTPEPCGGNNLWMTNLTGPYNNNEDSWVQSPCLDLSGVSGDLRVRFDHNFEIETDFDESYLEVSTNGGATWAKVGTFGTGQNWYNDAGNDWWEGNSGGWRQAANTLSGVGGSSDVYVRFKFQSDAIINQDGVGFDNILFYTDLTDASANYLTGPASSCGLGTSEVVSGVFQNNGTDTLTSINVCYSVNNGTPVCETVTVTLLPGDTLAHTFSTGANLSTPGDYEIRLFPTVPGDTFYCGDTALAIVSNAPQVSVFPYVERFENGTGGWIPGGVNETWDLGLPAKTNINGAASGVNAYVNGGLTGQYANLEESYLLGPCFDFSGTSMTEPWLAMNVWWEIENSWDGANVQYSLDSGANWITIGAVGDPFNWYNDNSISANPGGVSDGWTGTTADIGPGQWVSVKHPLDTAILGQPYVLFRVAFASDGIIVDEGIAVDDIAIGQPPVVNLGADTTICSGYMLDAGYTIGTYEWSTGDTTQMISVSNASGIVRMDTISVAYTDTFGICGFDTIILMVEPEPLVSLGADTTICFGSSTTLNAGPGSSYIWSSGATTQTISVSNAGVYSVTATSLSNGCQAIDSIEIFLSTPVALGPDTVVCAGDTLMLMSSITGTYAWSTGATTQSIGVTTGGTFSVTVTDGLGCSSTDDVVVTLEQTPSAAFNFSIGGAGLVYTFTDASTGSPNSWSWDFGDGNSSPAQNPQHTYASPGSYMVTLYVSNSCGQDSLVQTIMVTALEGELSESTVAIYPNPNQGDFDISFHELDAKAVEVTVNNMYGQRIFHREIGAVSGNASEKLELHGFSQGVYFVKITADGRSLTRKVVVE